MTLLPTDMGTTSAPRLVQRGFLVFGGESLATGDILDDAWVFDLTNLNTGVCPWIELPLTGFPRHSGGMAWDPTTEEFIQLGGYTSSGSTAYATKTVLAASVDDLVDGTGWTAADTLPEREYSTSKLSDTTDTSGEIWPSLDCNADEIRNVTCMEDPVRSAIRADAGTEDEDGYCAYGGAFDHATYVVDWVGVSPCDTTATCCVTEGSETTCTERSTPYTDACADDPQCTVAATTDAYSSATAPGVAELAFALAATTGAGWAFGGATGCVGSCGDWEGVADLDGAADQALDMANRDRLYQVVSGVTSDQGTAHAGTLGSAENPPDTSYGRRGAAGAYSGAAWDHDTQDFTAGGNFVLVGGTHHQDLGVGIRHEIACADASGADMLICTDFCVDLSSTWVEGNPAFADLGAGLVDGTSVVAVLDAATLDWDLQGNPGARAYPAATWFGDAQVLVWGGQADGYALSDLFVWDTSVADRTTWAPSEPWGDRSGGSALYDPVSRVAYLYGGADDSQVYTYSIDELAPDDNVIRLEGSVSAGIATRAIEATLASTDGARWTLGGSYESEVACDSGTDCWVEDLAFYVATQSPAELDTLTVHVEYNDRGDAYDLEPYWDGAAGTGFTELRVRLPRIVTDGRSVDVEVEWTSEARPETTYEDCRNGDRADGAMCQYEVGRYDTSTATDLRSTVSLITAQPVTPSSLSASPLAITTTFTLPTGWQGVAPGAPDSAGSTFTGLENLHPTGQTPNLNLLLAMDGLSLHDTVTTAAASITVWVDDGIDLASSPYGDYLTATTGDARPQADIDWLETNIVPLPDWPMNMLLLRRSEAEESAYINRLEANYGEATAGTVLLWGADTDGVPGYFLRATTIHEFSHQSLYYRNQPAQTHTDDARWFVEGSATLVEWMRLGDQAEFYTGDMANLDVGKMVTYEAATTLATATCNGAGDLEIEGADTTVAYTYGGYTMLQLHASYLALGGSTAGFWSELEGFGDTRQLVDAAALSELITLSLGLPDFYTQWVMQNRIGTPLLALTALEPDISACTGTGACEPTAADARIEQVQVSQLTIANGCVADAPLFTDVPFYLSCTVDNTGELAFAQCGATRNGLVTTIPDTTSARIHDTTLTIDPVLGLTSPWPVEIELLAGDALLPLWMPTAGYRYKGTTSRDRAFLFCADVDDPDCGGDADGDGYAVLSECDDANTAWNPAATHVAFTGRSRGDDNNCDGW